MREVAARRSCADDGSHELIIHFCGWMDMDTMYEKDVEFLKKVNSCGPTTAGIAARPPLSRCELKNLADPRAALRSRY